MAAGFTIRTGVQEVAASGTPEALLSSKTFAYSVEIVAQSDNTGDIFIGDSSVAATDAPRSGGDSVTLSGPLINGTQYEIDLSTIFIRVATNGDGVQFTYLAKVD